MAVAPSTRAVHNQPIAEGQWAGVLLAVAQPSMWHAHSSRQMEYARNRNTAAILAARARATPARNA